MAQVLVDEHSIPRDGADDAHRQQLSPRPAQERRLPELGLCVLGGGHACRDVYGAHLVLHTR